MSAPGELAASGERGRGAEAVAPDLSASPDQPSRFAQRTQEVRALTRRWFITLARDRLGLVFGVAQPAIWLAFFGSAVGRTVDPAVVGDGDYLRFVLPGVVAFTVVGNGVSGAMPLLWDKETGYLDKLLTMPVARMSILLSRILAQIALGAAQVVVILLVAAVLGTVVGPSIWLLILLVSAVATVATTSAALALAYSVKGHETFFAVSGFLSIPLLFLSTAFVPADAMAGWFAAIAQVNPVSFAIQAMRSGIEGDWAGSGRWLAATTVVAALCLAGATARYRRRTAERT